MAVQHWFGTVWPIGAREYSEIKESVRMQEKRAVFFGFAKSEKIGLAWHLTQINCSKPVLWIAKERYEPNVRQFFPDTIFYPSPRATELHRPPQFQDHAWPIVDVSVVQAMAKHENTLWPLFLRQRLPRNSALGMDLKHLYFQHLTFWSNMLREVRPELVFFSSLPIHFWSYAVYRFARENQITTITYLHTRLPGKLRIPVESFETGSMHLRQRRDEILKGDSLVEIPEDIEVHVSKLRNDYRHGIPDYLRRKFGVDSHTGLLKPKFDPTRVDRFQNYLHVLLMFPRIRSPRRVLSEIRHIRRREVLRRCYESLASPVDDSQPYVIVMLHQQPEASTSPVGGPFVHQMLMIDLLVRALPQGWKLYVKEHPSQLHWGMLNVLFRNEEYYKEILAYPNVSLVPSCVPSFTLIDNARAVATVTGRVGWEAVNRGKPALVFGHPWYRDCGGVFYSPDEPSCRAALNQIAAGYRVDQREVRAFLKALCEIAVPDFKMQEGFMTKNHDRCARSYADLLTSHFPNAGAQK